MHQLLILSALFATQLAYSQTPGMGQQGSQMGSGMTCDCSGAMKMMMNHSGGIFFMILIGLLLIALIAALIGLTIFLVRRSQSGHSR